MEETGKEKRYSRDPEANQIKKRDRRRKKILLRWRHRW